MTISKNSLALAAAFAGLIGGTAARAAKPIQSSAAVSSAGAAADKAKKDIEKHACKLQNCCKGNGGGSKKEWGKNSCKGQSACATDGSKK
jgi:hypothetical protein